MTIDNVEAAALASKAYRFPDGFLVLSKDLSVDEQTAVIHSLVLAYAAADKAHEGDRSRAGWATSFRDTLGKVGWVSWQSSSETYHSVRLKETLEGVSRDLPVSLRELARRAAEAAYAATAPEVAPAGESRTRVFNLCGAWREGEMLVSSVAFMTATLRVRSEDSIARDPQATAGEAAAPHQQTVETQVDYQWHVVKVMLNQTLHDQVKDAIAKKIEPVLSRYVTAASDTASDRRLTTEVGNERRSLDEHRTH